MSFSWQGLLLIFHVISFSDIDWHDIIDWANRIKSDASLQKAAIIGKPASPGATGGVWGATEGFAVRLCLFVCLSTLIGPLPRSHLRKS
jgi:hypothetical protein